METLIKADKTSTLAYRAMLGVERALAQSSLSHSLRHLIQVRVSQINGCAFCIDMHWNDARAAGETEQRLYGLSAWRDVPYYTDRERAALLLAEELTLIAGHGELRELYDQIRPHFTEVELGDLVWAIAAINFWNRISIGYGSVPAAVPMPSLVH